MGFWSTLYLTNFARISICFCPNFLFFTNILFKFWGAVRPQHVPNKLRRCLVVPFCRFSSWSKAPFNVGHDSWRKTKILQEVCERISRRRKIEQWTKAWLKIDITNVIQFWACTNYWTHNNDWDLIHKECDDNQERLNKTILFVCNGC